MANMPASPIDGRREGLSNFRFLRSPRISHLRVAILSLGMGLAFFPSHHVVAQTPASTRGVKTASANSTSKPADQKKWGKLQGYAVWYDVPRNSLARRRAGQNELTAAQNRLPLGTVVRVTHLTNGKSVVVRITDRGITDRHSLIDVCKEAAEKLGMIHEGSAPVRLDVLSDESGNATLGVSPPIATHR
jgi:rare lipoprotein A (peptidoglycan hydrolase)